MQIDFEAHIEARDYKGQKYPYPALIKPVPKTKPEVKNRKEKEFYLSPYNLDIPYPNSQAISYKKTKNQQHTVNF